MGRSIKLLAGVIKKMIYYLRKLSMEKLLDIFLSEKFSFLLFYSKVCWWLGRS